MKRSKLLQLLLAAVATVALGWLVVSQLSPGDLAKLARSFDFRLYALGFAAYLGANVVRATRFRVLVGEGISVRAFLRIIFVQNFMNTFLPLRAGEVSYLYMVHRAGGVTAGQSLGSLLAARALDFIVAVFIPLAASPLSSAAAMNESALVWLGAVVASGAGALFAIVANADRIAAALSRRFAEREGFVARGARLFADTLLALGQLRQRRRFGRILLLSILCWACIYASGLALLAGAGLELSVPDGIFAYGFPTIVSMTPIYMFGGFGVYESSFGAGLTMVGVPVAAALASGVLLHVAELSFIVALVLCAPLLGRDAKRAEST